jgi:hypothetical protein
MSVPPRTERDRSDWEVSGEQPRSTRQTDRVGVGMVMVVLLAVVLAVVLLVVL